MNIRTTFVVLLACFLLTESRAQDSQKPNVIIIFNDDMGYADVGCYGARKSKRRVLIGWPKRAVALPVFTSLQPSVPHHGQLC